jgi:Mg2+ and Co2+ transporter CorA
MSSNLTIKRWSSNIRCHHSCHSTPYLDGYRDFSEWPPTEARTPSSLNQAMFDDLSRFHLTSSTSHSPPSASEIPLAAYRILASHWNLQLEYLVSVVSKLEKGLLKFEQMDAHPNAESINAEVTALRVVLSDVNAWRRRVYFYLEQVLWNIEILGMPVKYNEKLCEGCTGIRGAEETSAATMCTTDFRTTHTHLLLLRDRIQSLLPTVMGAFSLLEAQHSVLKADLTIRLSGVALVFVPLSFTASLLSMSGEFIPGERLFWVFWAVSVPLICILFWWGFAVQIGRYARWAWVKVRARCRGWHEEKEE